MACSTMGSGHSRGKRLLSLSAIHFGLKQDLFYPFIRKHTPFISKYQLQFLSSSANSYNDGSNGGTTPSDYVEDFVCNESDLQENEMKAFDMPDDSGKVLVIKQKGKITAIGSKCTHYGAPLIKGVLGDGHVRCPWHGACFNVTTGDIEDFPGLDSLPCFDVSVEDGRVKVKAHKDALKSSKIVKAMTSPCGKDSRTFVVIGGGAAGACAVETLRQEGFSGKIIMITSELALPYDRIKLSKMLDANIAKLQLREESFYKDHGIEVQTGKIVTSVNTTDKKVCLNDGSEISYSRLLVASGSRANTANQPGSELGNIFSLRTIADANSIFKVLNKESDVVIVGASFIGMEAAAYCVGKVKSVTVVGRGSVPFQPILGQEVGARIKQLFDEKGVKFCLGLDVSSFEGEDSVSRVKLSDGQALPANVVILGIGAQPSTSFLQGSGIEMQRGAIVVNKFMESSISDVFVAGDAAYAPVFAANDRAASIGHWQLAHYHGRIAALNMVGKQTELKSVPFFWTMLFGTSVRYSGYGAGFDDIIITGDLAALSFIAHYCIGNEVVAVATVGSDPAAAKFAELLGLKKSLSKDAVKKNDDALSSDGSNAMETHISFHQTTEELEEDDFKENCSSRTLVARNQAKKAKRVRFLRNGDRFFKGVVMPVAAERYRSFDSLLSDLTRALEHSVTLPCGVRTIYTMDGRKVQSIDQLDDGKEYLCSGPGETFKRVDYSNNNGTLGKKKPNAVPGGGDRPRSGGTSRSGIPEFVRPRILTLVRNGTRPRKVVRLLINRRNAPSMDHVLSCITEAVKLDTGAARKVFSQSGVQVTQFEDFFGEDDVFFVYGSERYSQEDFELDEEEYKSIQSQRKGAMWNRGGNGRVSAPGGIMPKMPGKTKAAKSQSEALLGTTDPNIPSAINTKYLVLETIGDGNFAQVRRCVDRSSGREFALKIIEKSRCRGKEHMIESEVDILRKVRHPNIVRLFAEHDEPEQLYLVMELVKGGDLFDAIASATKFNEWDSSIMIRNLASALCYLHSLSIVHRDIKPENLLVEVDGHGVHTLKVGDFGLAQKVTEPLFSVCGTPTYVAPEILAETGYGLKIDVWAAGVILYILLCGFPPFVSATNDQEELFTRILAARFAFTSPYWDDISDSAKDLVAHMLQPVPELRLSAEDVLDHPWLAEAGGVEMLRVNSGGSLLYGDTQMGVQSAVSR